MYACVPFKSCSLFGALRYFANIKNSVILVHGPSGCTFFSRYAMIRLNGYYNSPYPVPIPKIYCTDFSENDVIFGGRKKLCNALTEIMDVHSPEVVFVMNCCVSEVIGEDIDDVASEYTNEYRIPVIPVHSAGFKGDHKYGMKMASEILFEQFMTEKISTQKRRINILGDLDYFNHTSKELIAMLNEVGVTDIHLVPGNCTIDELRQCTSAELNIITCGNASRHLAELMKNKYGIPYMGNNADMFGIENTYKMYCKLFDFLGIDKVVLDNKRREAMAALEEHLHFFKGKSAAIVSGTRRAMGYAKVFQELGIEVKFIFSECDNEYVQKNEFMQYSKNICVNEYPLDLLERIEELNPDFIMSTLSELIAPYQYISRTDDDFVGFSGIIRMAEHLKAKYIEGEKLFVRILDGKS